MNIEIVLLDYVQAYCVYMLVIFKNIDTRKRSNWIFKVSKNSATFIQ